MVCLEVFDDVGVERPDGTRVAEQNKSNLTYNPLSDRAVDLWKTLRIWLDEVESGELDADRTTFTLYTSNPAGGTIAQSLHDARTINEAMAAIARAEAALLGSTADADTRSVSELLTPHLERLFRADRSIVAKIVCRFTFESGKGSPHEDLKVVTMQKLVSEDRCEEVISWALGWIKRQTDQLMEQGKPARLAQDIFHKAMLHYVQTHDRIDILRSFAGRVLAQPLQAEDALRTYVRQLNQERIHRLWR